MKLSHCWNMFFLFFIFQSILFDWCEGVYRCRTNDLQKFAFDSLTLYGILFFDRDLDVFLVSIFQLRCRHWQSWPAVSTRIHFRSGVFHLRNQQRSGGLWLSPDQLLQMRYLTAKFCPVIMPWCGMKTEKWVHLVVDIIIYCLNIQ